MPAYNAAPVISEAIRSLRAQTYPLWELLITDDGSTDATATVVRSFDDPRIKLIQQSNRGVSVARNRSLDIASGEFITFLDADDGLPPKSLESRVQLLQREQDVDVVDGVFVVCGPKLSTNLKTRYPGPRGALLPKLLRLDERVFRNACFMFRCSLLGHLRFQPGMTHAEDLLFFIELAATHQPIYAPVSEPTYFYRTGLGSAMTNLDGLEQGYFQLLRQLRRIPQLSWRQRLPTHLRIARILLATWLRYKRPIRGLSAASRALLWSLSPALN
jgi:teichuronic acid biosynthesis glycosyltransferase TuaG